MLTTRGLMALAVAILGWLGWIAVARIRVEYWDGLDCLNNARVLAGQRFPELTYQYANSRPPLVPLLLSVVTRAFYRPIGEGLWAAHLVCFGLAAAAIWATFAVLRRGCSTPAAALGAVLVLLNPLFIHYAPMVMADLICMMFAALLQLAYLRACDRASTGRIALAGLALGAVACTRYNAVVFGASLALFELLCAFVTPSQKPDRGHLRRTLLRPQPWAAAGVAVASFLAVHWLAYQLAPMEGAQQSSVLGRLQDGLRAAAQAAGAFETDPWTEYPQELLATAGAPFLLLSLIGLGLSLVRRTRVDLLQIAWLVVFLPAMTWWIGHKEARYVLPILPTLAYFAMVALDRAWERVRGRRWGVAAMAGAGLVLLGVAGAGMLGEARRFSDPAYARPVLPEAARWILESAGPEGEVIIGGGRAFSIYSRDPITLPLDEYIHFHHINNFGFEYFLDRPVRGFQVRLAPSGSRPGPETLPGMVILHLPAESAQRLGADSLALMVEAFPHGAALIALPPVMYEGLMGAARIPEPPPPLKVTRVERATLRRAAGEGAAPSYRAVGTELSVTLVPQQGRWIVPPLPPGWRAYFRRSEADAVAPISGELDAPPEILELVRTEERLFRVR
ncbi:MAG TPA: glycosyltransferase family 39 protein [Myxococcaceae bacterium]